MSGVARAAGADSLDGGGILIAGVMRMDDMVRTSDGGMISWASACLGMDPIIVAYAWRELLPGADHQTMYDAYCREHMAAYGVLPLVDRRGWR